MIESITNRWSPRAFEINSNFKVITVIALGFLGDKSTLPEGIAEKESPISERKPLTEYRFSKSF
jgi:hypothetical protein